MTIYHSSRVYLQSLPMKEEKLISSVGSFADGLFLSLWEQQEEQEEEQEE